MSRGSRIVNLTGDGLNIEFQQATIETESQRPEAKLLVFRVGLGLHLVNIRPGHTARTPVATQHQQMLD
jgi:hypothetical protein